MNLPIRLLTLVLGLALTPAVATAEAERWVLQDGTEIFGEPQSYDFESKKATLLKADGKEYLLDATELSLAGKLQLFHSRAFGEALKGYSPPLAPMVVVFFTGCLFLVVPLMLGVWGGAHVLGAVESPKRHSVAVGKVIIIVLGQIVIYLTASTVMDPDLPLIPDKNGDIVLILCLIVMGLLVSALVFSGHYHQTFFRGLGIALLSGVFAGIVSLALTLVGLFLFMRSDTETIMNRFVFQPLDWF